MSDWRSNQEEVDNWWWWHYEESWDSQLWESGFAVLYQVDIDGELDTSYSRDTQVTNLVEYRWGPSKCPVSSRLWDSSKPQDAYSGAVPTDRKKRAYVRSKMPKQLAQLKRRKGEGRS